MNFNISEKLIGFGVVGLFFFVFPLFSYHRWKDKDVKDYILTKENFGVTLPIAIGRVTLSAAIPNAICQLLIKNTYSKLF